MKINTEIHCPIVLFSELALYIMCTLYRVRIQAVFHRPEKKSDAPFLHKDISPHV